MPEADDPDELRAELLHARIELTRTRAALERVAEAEAEAVADNRRWSLRLAEVESSSLRRLEHRVRRAASRLGPTGAGRDPLSLDDELSLPVVSLRPDLVEGWPEDARWRPDARIPGVTVTALEQPVGTTVRYRLSLPSHARIAGRVALSARVWREAAAGVVAIARLRDEAGHLLHEESLHLPVAEDWGTWDAQSFTVPCTTEGNVTLELSALAQPAQRPAPGVLWIAPSIVLDRRHGPSARSLPPRAAPSPASTQPSEAIRFSILTPVRDPDVQLLAEMLHSVRCQTHTDWQLCLVDDGSADHRVRDLLEEAAGADPRVMLERRVVAGGISEATNQAVAMASGDYVAFLDHDDRLAPDALALASAAIEADPDLDILYSDEDHLTHAGRRFLAYRKPEWSPDSMRSQMYTGHLSVLRRRLIEEVGGLRPEFDGSQDYDLLLRLTERTDRIAHVGQLLYHWRTSARSASAGAHAKPYAYEAARRSLQEHIDRIGAHGSVGHGASPGTYRIDYDVDPRLTVDVVLPVGGLAADGAKSLLGCLTAGGHERWTIVLAGPDDDTRRWASALVAVGLTGDRVHSMTSGTSCGAAHGAATRASHADHMLLLDGVPTDGCDGWMRALLGFAAQPGVGAAGAKVLAPDGRVEHGGIVIGDGLPLAVLHGSDGDEAGYLTTLKTTVNRSAVSGVVMLAHEALEKVGALDESLGGLAVIDYCLRASERGLRVIWTPDARLALAGHRPRNEVAALIAFRARWLDRLPVDPFYSRALWQERADYTPLDSGER